MAQQKKNIARLVLQGISILGIIFGFCCFFSAIFIIFSILRGKLDIDFVWLIQLAVLLVLGAFLLYPSYLMLRGRSFEIIKSISVLLALPCFGLFWPFVEILTTSGSGKMSRFIENIVVLASGLFFVVVVVLVYSICVKLLRRLVKAAYGTNNISGTQHSTDKQ